MSRFLAIALLGLLGCGPVSAQPARRPRPCTVGTFSFACPKGYEIKNATGATTPYLAFHPKHKFYLYAHASDISVPSDELMVQTLRQSFRTLFDIDYSEIQTKASDDFWSDDRWSKFEVSKFAKASLANDKNLGLHYQYVLLKLGGKQVVVGYVYNAAPPRPAETWYQTWTGGGFGDASDGLQNLILGITKEKRPVLTPGGPPPGA